MFVVQGDISQADSIKEALGKVKKEFGSPIDIMVCNAGYLSRFEALAEADFDEWWKVRL